MAVGWFCNFSPISIAGLRLWLKADALQGLADGNALTTWPDSSRSGNNFTQTTAANQPTYQTAEVNSLPCVRFVTDDFLDGLATSSFISASAYTTWVVYKATSNVAEQPLISDGIFFTSVFWSLAINASNIVVRNNDGSDDQSTVSADVAGSWTWARGRHDTGTIYAKTKGGAESAGTASGNTATLTDTVRIGAYNAANNPFGGDIAEILVYNTVVSAEDRTKVENYLASKYAL
jgi:hypothetical protein